jgi:parvulin-like peptidyl-prolyl isomerase
MLLRRFWQWITARYEAADKSLLTNLAFLSAIALSAILLFGAIGANIWSNTFATAISVNGASISVGEAKARADIELFRYGLESARIRARVSAGTLSSEQGNAIIAQINESATNISSQITSEMIDVLLVNQLAAERSLKISQDVIDAEWAKESTLPELRLLRRITIDIADDPQGDEPSAATIAEAQTRADAIAEEIAAGGDFATIAKRESDDTYAAEGGRIGWSSRDEDPLTDLGYAAAWELTAVGPTGVIKRANDQFVIFYVDQIRASTPDADFAKRASDAGIDMDLYMKTAAERALRTALSEAVTAELLVDPVEQRDVSFLSIQSPGGGGMAEEVRVRHLLFSPNDDAQKAERLDENDPAWAAAEAEAEAAIVQITAGTPFEDLAVDSDDESSAKDGGLLDWAVKGTYVPEFDEAVWADGLEKGELLGPIKTQFGYHVIQFEERRAGIMLRLEQLASELAEAGDDFNTVAEAAAEEIDGLSVDQAGFVVRYAINPALSSIVWGLDAGEVSGVETLGEQLVIIRVNAVETKPYTDSQRSTVETSGFAIWLDGHRSDAAISIDGAVVQEAGESPAP